MFTKSQSTFSPPFDFVPRMNFYATPTLRIRNPAIRKFLLSVQANVRCSNPTFQLTISQLLDWDSQSPVVKVLDLWWALHKLQPTPERWDELLCLRNNLGLWLGQNYRQTTHAQETDRIFALFVYHRGNMCIIRHDGVTLHTSCLQEVWQIYPKTLGRRDPILTFMRLQNGERKILELVWPDSLSTTEFQRCLVFNSGPQVEDVVTMKDRFLAPLTLQTSTSSITPNRSLTGCQSCKSRKKKCDERKPSCGNCMNRQRVCNYVSVRSRTGCQTCKTRKVKCDERKPSCGNCMFRQRICSNVSDSFN